MIARILLFLSVLSLPALAQIQVLQFDGTTEIPVGSVVDMGSAAPGDVVEVRFRVRNIGSAMTPLQTLSITGAGFKISVAPSLPYTLAPYSGPASEAEFRVAFNPTAAGAYSGFLLVNTINIIVRGTATASAALTLAGSSAPLAAGAVIDFGSLLRGGSRLQNLTLSNSSAGAITVGALTVSGTGFRGPIGAAAPVQLAAGQSVSFQIAFEPLTGQPAKGTLTVDKRSFSLTGQGLDPPLPTASIVFGSPTAASSQQNTVSIPLASASQVSGTGTLTLEFRSGVTGITDDSAIQFMSGPKRAATVTIAVGDTTAKFGTQSSISFQTGATAGTLVFTLTLPTGLQQTSLTVAPASINIDTATGVRRVNDLDISLTGFDNTYSASQLAFTFFDRSGATMQPGVIRVDVTSDFRLYFNSTKTGGAFALLATFPVSGDATQVGGADVQITNSAGVAKTQRINF
ncbi:MAG TPA: choice-of-anchor D domain-containing protein [Bryobacteraceae bacterium]